MTSASFEILPAVLRWPAFWPRMSVAALYLGLLLFYFPVLGLGPAGLALVMFALALAIVAAPLEYALAALACAFVFASCVGLGAVFQSLRWIYLVGAALILPLRFFLLKTGSARPAPNTFAFLLALFLASAISSLMVSVSPTMSELKLGALLCLFWVLWPSAASLVESYGPAAPRKLAEGLLAYLLPVGLISLAGLARPAGHADGSGRFSGLMGNANSWATLVIITLPLLACSLFRRPRRPRKKNVLASLGALVFLYSLLLSTSRSAILGTALAACTFCCMHASRRVAAVAALCAVLFTSQVLARPDFLPSLLSNYVFKHKAARDQLNPFESRIQPWRVAKAHFQENPWLGLGFGVTSKAEANWSFDVRSGGRSVETGSSIWSSLSQVGICGSLPLFLAILLLMAGAGRFAWKVKDPSFTGLYASTLALAVNAAFEGWLIAPGSFPTTVFWLACFFLNALICRFRPAPARSAFMPAPPAAPGSTGARL
jgi:O-antigen ligase